MSVRSHACVVVGLGAAMACFASAVAVAEASFPGTDGWIAFSRESAPFNAEGWGADTIWLVAPRSGQTRQITRPSRRCGRFGWAWSDSHPSFSASGRLLTYTHIDGCDPRVPDGIYVMRVDGSGRRLIRRADEDEFETLDFPVFSPSGRQVASEVDGSSQIISVPRTGERPVGACDVDRRCSEVFFPRYSEVLHPAWSSGGKLAFTLTGFEGGEEETGHIGIATPGDLDRESVTRLATRSSRDAMPDWSPNEDRLVFHREKMKRTLRDLEGNVLTAVSRGKHRRPRRLTDTRDAFFPVWSPSGRKIAFGRGEWGSSNGTLWIMRAADGRRKRLLATGVYTSRISWQPRPRR